MTNSKEGRSRRDVLVSPRNGLLPVAVLCSRRRLRTCDLGLWINAYLAGSRLWSLGQANGHNAKPFPVQLVGQGYDVARKALIHHYYSLSYSKKGNPDAEALGVVVPSPLATLLTPEAT